MSFIKSLAVAALATTVFAHPQHNHAKRNEPYGSIISKCTVAGTVALTFDDGPYIYTDTLLDKLAAVGFKATFFQNGNNWASIYNYNSTLKRMITDGHQIASHTWDHKDLATLTSAQVTAEMSQLEVAYMNILGYYPYYMRPPFLSTNAQALTVLADMNYVVVEVDIDTQDWQNLQVSQEPYSFSNYTAGYAAGGRLSLSHDPYDTTVNGYIPDLLAWMVQNDLKSVPVGECLGDPQANWYRTTRTNTYNPYIAVASSSASKSASATSSSASASKSASSSVVPSSVKPSSVSASASAVSSSKASSSVAASSAVASSAPSSSKSSSAAAASSAPASSKSSSAAAASSKASSSAAAASSIKPSSVVASSVASSAAAASPSASAKATTATPDGSCGGSANYACDAGECCSPYGWCGTSIEYCGNGCQAAFGTCTAGSGTTTTGPISQDGECGSNGMSCASGECCSEYGWCGTSSAYCGTGCQSGFGECD